MALAEALIGALGGAGPRVTVGTGVLDKRGREKTTTVPVTDYADLAALSLMYIHSQDAVPWFQLDHTVVGGVRGIKISWRERPSPEVAEAFYNHVQKYMPYGEFTLIGNDMLFLNYDKAFGEEWAVPDKKFQDTIAKAKDTYTGPGADAILEVVTKDIRAAGNYIALKNLKTEEGTPATWRAESAARAAIESEISNRGRSDLLPWLRDRRKAVESLREDFKAAAGRITQAPREVALGITAPSALTDKQATSLVGKRVRSPADLAALAQVYRNPNYEILRYFFTDKKGKVIFQTAVSAREPASSSLFPTGLGPQWLQQIIDAMTADPEVGRPAKLWMLHNHPSGSTLASPEDIEATRTIADQVAGKLIDVEHVVIDSGEYSVITPQANIKPVAKMHNIDVGEEKHLVPSRAHSLLDTVISTPSEMLSAATKLKAESGWVTVIGATKRKTGNVTAPIVRGVMEVPVEHLNNRKREPALLRRLARHMGSSMLFLVETGQHELDPTAVQHYMESGQVLDSVLAGGIAASRVVPITQNRPAPTSVTREVGEAITANARKATSVLRDEPPAYTRTTQETEYGQESGEAEKATETGAGGPGRAEGVGPQEVPAEPRTARADAERLEGLESRSPGPNPDVQAVARAYAQRAGITHRRQSEYVRVDPERATRIAQAYEDMEHAPNDPAVRAAYRSLIEQG